jgi:hypothetical protein
MRDTIEATALELAEMLFQQFELAPARAEKIVNIGDVCLTVWVCVRQYDE